MDKKTIKTIEKVMNRNSANPKENSHKYYKYIPADGYIIMNIYKKVLERIKKRKKHFISVLDVGSGIGGAILTMRTVERMMKINKVIRYSGLEIDPNLIPIADRLLKENWKESETIQCNALNFKNYKEYDIIYYYHPIEDEDLQKRLERKIEKDAKKGTIVMAILKEECPMDEKYRLNIKDWKIIYNNGSSGIVMEKIR